MSTKQISREETERILFAKSFLLNQLHLHLTVAQLAAQASMSEEKFKDCFYKLFGVNVTDYVLETRMQLSHFLLLHTDKPIKEIASIVGFKHTSNFRTAFKNYFKKMPSTIRNT